MSSSLHVSLPDEMRAFVDQRTNNKHEYATPSEYIRDLIRRDMRDEAGIASLVRSQYEMERGAGIEITPSAIFDEE
ncbi:MAG: CopG family transcriptional regulator [Rhodospirillaceae bacterium]|nr:CopG family transcriptional regulator [Rhodospirillaceae bacterium]